MKAIEIKLPENIGLTNLEIKMNLAAKLYDQGKLSSGQAADMVGISKREFIDSLGKYGVSVFGYDSTELIEDMKNVR